MQQARLNLEADIVGVYFKLALGLLLRMGCVSTLERMFMRTNGWVSIDEDNSKRDPKPASVSYSIRRIDSIFFFRQLDTNLAFLFEINRLSIIILASY